MKDWDVFDIIGNVYKGDGMFIIGLLYLVLVVLGVLWVIAWITMPYKLDRVNKNLEEIKELLRESHASKKSRKPAGE